LRAHKSKGNRLPLVSPQLLRVPCVVWVREGNGVGLACFNYSGTNFAGSSIGVSSVCLGLLSFCCPSAAAASSVAPPGDALPWLFSLRIRSAVISALLLSLRFFAASRRVSQDRTEFSHLSSNSWPIKRSASSNRPAWPRTSTTQTLCCS